VDVGLQCAFGLGVIVHWDLQERQAQAQQVGAVFNS
jgi:hypothetical protein